MDFIFSQICGLIVSVAAIVSMQLKNVKWILVCQLICNGIGALSYILLDGLSGCGIYLVALLQSIVFYIYRQGEEKDTPPWMVFIFIFSFIGCSIATYKTPTDIISAIAAMTCALSIAQKKPSGYRIFMLLNGIIWMVYDVSVCAYTMILSHIATTLSAMVGIIRLDIKKEKI